MNKAESKFLNSSKKMNKAMISLIESKDFNEITVTNVCKIAGVNRSTFYAHYNNTLELLEETRDSYIAEVFSLYTLNSKDIINLSVEDAVFINEKYLVPLLTFIKDNKKTFKIFMNNIRSFNADNMFNVMIEQVFMPIYKKHNITDKKVIEYTAKYYLTGTMAIITDWLNKDCVDDIEFLCKVIKLCVRPDIQ